VDRANVSGVMLEYEDTGEGEPVVLIHGAFIADAFGPMLGEPALAGRYRFISYHRRGYVGSGGSAGPVTIPQQAADCLTLLSHLGVERAHVAGHSFGGSIALQLALDAPAVVHSLALLEPAMLLGAGAAGYRDSLARDEQRYKDGDAAGAVDQFLRARFGTGYRAAWLERTLPGAFAQAVADAGTAFALDMRALPDWHFTEVEARRITQPVLTVLGGLSDALWPRFGETHRALLAWLPQAEAFILPDATHGLQIQNPRDMAAALAHFWARHPLAIAA
jgi:pimeloyl-ACP methyl ester carboxylesterase